MKNKHRIKQCLSLLLAGGIALTNLGAVMPAFAEDAPATPENAEAVTPETAEADTTAPNLVQITENLYNDLPDAPTGSYLGSMGLPVATGETKIGISAWVSDLYDGVDAHMDADALNADENTVTIGKTPGTDYAIVPLLAQVEYPADGAVSEIILPDGVELLSYLSTDYEPIPADDREQAEILHQTYSEQSAAATGLYVKASADFTAQLVYTDSDGSSQSKAIQVQISEDVTPTQMYADTGDDGIAAYAAGPTPPYTTGKITSIAKEGGTWLIWFNGQEAYCCSHGLNGQPKGCPTYSFSHVSRLEPGQYTPGNHYANQVNIWGGLGQLSLDMLDDRPVVASLEDDPEGCEEQPDILGSLYDETQQWIMENYPDSYAAQTYIAAAEELINGTDAQSGENGYLPGAVYELYTVDDIYSADGTKLLDAGTKLAESSPTNESGFTWFAVDIPVRAETYPDSGNSGRYQIVEVKAPAGYLLDSTPVDVEFTYEGQQIAWQVVNGTNTNLRTSVDISKQDITNGKELPGAKLEIRDADGSLVEGWTSGKVPHTVRGLELEKEYTLTEKRAPDGYAEAESIVFKLVQEGTEQVNKVYVKSNDDWTKLDEATVILQDAPVLDIDKTDIACNLLPGATLTIRDADGEAIDTWVTDYKTHRVPISDEFIKLSGEAKEYIYTLTEDAAPAGFEIANSVQFKLETVDDGISLFVRENVDAEWVRADKRLIQMIDETTPREDTPTPTPAPTPQPTPAATPVPTPAPTPVIAPRKVQTLPQTGDGFPLLAIVVVSLASATGIVLLTVKQRNALKETSDKEDADESSDR